MVSGMAQRLDAQVRSAEAQYHRLVLLVGGPRTGKTSVLSELAEKGSWPMINVNLALCERLLELTVKQRALRIQELLGEIVEEHQSDVVILDNTEVLFSKELQQDPLRLLERISRNRTVVVAWAGEYDGANLTYADSAYPEFRRYHKPDAVIVSALDTQDQTE